MKTTQSELARRIVPITDEREIGIIERDETQDIVGWCDSGGHYWAYTDTVRKYRRRQAKVQE